MGLPVMSTYSRPGAPGGSNPKHIKTKNVVYPHYGIYSAKKSIDTCYNIDDLENMLNERSQTQRSHLILLNLCNVSKMK
jgi:hypothetical protein